MIRKPLAAASALAIGLSAAFAGDAFAASASIRISLSVPAECFLSNSQPLMIDNGGSATGTVTEACNSGGYMVKADYRPLASDESATLQYGGTTISLPPGGETVVRVSDMATVKQMSYALQGVHLDQPLAVSLNIQAM